MYVSDFAISLIIYSVEFMSISMAQLFEELAEVSIKIFVCHVHVTF